MNLTDVPVDELVAEVSRRMHCLDKPEKRVIMVGRYMPLSMSIYLASSVGSARHGIVEQ